MALKAIRLAVMVSSSYAKYQEAVAVAKDEARQKGAEVVLVSEVLSCFDMALPAKAILTRPDVDAVVVIGIVTSVSYRVNLSGRSGKEVVQWDETIAHSTISLLNQLSIQANKPLVNIWMGPELLLTHVDELIEESVRSGVRSALQLVQETDRLRALPIWGEE